MSMKQTIRATINRLPLSELDNVSDTTPYFCTNTKIIEDYLENFIKELPSVNILYAIKANNSLEIIKLLDEKVYGFDVASFGEIDLLISNGINPSRIFFSNPVKVPAHIESAHNIGVKNFAFDSISELKKLASLAPGSNVYLRARVSDYGSRFPLSKKFGADPDHAVYLCSLAQDLGLKVVGITFHVGSQSENAETWDLSLHIVGKIVNDLSNHGIGIEFVNLGGGFPAVYSQPSPSISSVARVINRAVKKYLPKDIKLFAEPGRYLAANSTTCVTSIIGIEHRSGSDWVYLDIGAFQGLIEPLEMTELSYPIRSHKSDKGYNKNFTLTGPTCDACDTLGDGYSLPADLKIGDRLYIDAVGAYSLVYASNFNGFNIPNNYFINTVTEVGVSDE